MAGHNLAKIGHCPVGQLAGVPVEDFVEGVSRWKAAVEELEKLAANVGLDTFAEWWVEPQNTATPPPPPCSWCTAAGVVGE